MPYLYRTCDCQIRERQPAPAPAPDKAIAFWVHCFSESPLTVLSNNPELPSWPRSSELHGRSSWFWVEPVARYVNYVADQERDRTVSGRERNINQFLYHLLPGKTWVCRWEVRFIWVLSCVYIYIYIQALTFMVVLYVYIHVHVKYGLWTWIRSYRWSNMSTLMGPFNPCDEHFEFENGSLSLSLLIQSWYSRERN